MPHTTFGSYLFRARQRLTLDQSPVANLASVPLSTMERAEQGELTKRDAVSGEKLAGTPGIRIEALLRLAYGTHNATAATVVRMRVCLSSERR